MDGGPPDDASTRLAVYGSLAPGEANHGVVSGLGGEWSEGWVRGHLIDRGWGAGLGFPALVPDEAAGRVDVRVLESPRLPAAWERLDRFEGPGYRRVTLGVRGVEGRRGPLPYQVYVMAER